MDQEMQIRKLQEENQRLQRCLQRMRNDAELETAKLISSVISWCDLRLNQKFQELKGSTAVRKKSDSFTSQDSIADCYEKQLEDSYRTLQDQHPSPWKPPTVRKKATASPRLAPLDQGMSTQMTSPASTSCQHTPFPSFQGQGQGKDHMDDRRQQSKYNERRPDSHHQLPQYPQQQPEHHHQQPQYPQQQPEHHYKQPVYHQQQPQYHQQQHEFRHESSHLQPQYQRHPPGESWWVPFPASNEEERNLSSQFLSTMSDIPSSTARILTNDRKCDSRSGGHVITKHRTREGQSQAVAPQAMPRRGARDYISSQQDQDICIGIADKYAADRKLDEYNAWQSDTEPSTSKGRPWHRTHTDQAGLKSPWKEPDQHQHRQQSPAVSQYAKGVRSAGGMESKETQGKYRDGSYGTGPDLHQPSDVRHADSSRRNGSPRKGSVWMDRYMEAEKRPQRDREHPLDDMWAEQQPRHHQHYHLDQGLDKAGTNELIRPRQEVSPWRLHSGFQDTRRTSRYPGRPRSLGRGEWETTPPLLHYEDLALPQSFYDTPGQGPGGRNGASTSASVGQSLHLKDLRTSSPSTHFYPDEESCSLDDISPPDFHSTPVTQDDRMTRSHPSSTADHGPRGSETSPRESYGESRRRWWHRSSCLPLVERSFNQDNMPASVNPSDMTCASDRRWPSSSSSSGEYDVCPLRPRVFSDDRGSRPSIPLRRTFSKEDLARASYKYSTDSEALAHRPSVPLRRTDSELDVTHYNLGRHTEQHDTTCLGGGRPQRSAPKLDVSQPKSQPAGESGSRRYSDPMQRAPIGVPISSHVGSWQDAFEGNPQQRAVTTPSDLQKERFRASKAIEYKSNPALTYLHRRSSPEILVQSPSDVTSSTRGKYPGPTERQTLSDREAKKPPTHAQFQVENTRSSVPANRSVSWTSNHRNDSRAAKPHRLSWPAPASCENKQSVTSPLELARCSEADHSVVSFPLHRSVARDQVGLLSRDFLSYLLKKCSTASELSDHTAPLHRTLSQEDVALVARYLDKVHGFEPMTQPSTPAVESIASMESPWTPDRRDAIVALDSEALACLIAFIEQAFVYRERMWSESLDTTEYLPLPAKLQSTAERRNRQEAVDALHVADPPGRSQSRSGVKATGQDGGTGREGRDDRHWTWENDPGRATGTGVPLTGPCEVRGKPPIPPQEGVTGERQRRNFYPPYHFDHNNPIYPAPADDAGGEQRHYRGKRRISFEDEFPEISEKLNSPTTCQPGPSGAVRGRGTESVTSHENEGILEYCSVNPSMEGAARVGRGPATKSPSYCPPEERRTASADRHHPGSCQRHAACQTDADCGSGQSSCRHGRAPRGEAEPAISSEITRIYIREKQQCPPSCRGMQTSKSYPAPRLHDDTRELVFPVPEAPNSWNSQENLLETNSDLSIFNNAVLGEPILASTPKRGDATDQEVVSMGTEGRLLGELAFQVERRILDHVFCSPGHVPARGQRRYYGYTVANLPCMIHEEAKDQEAHEDRAKEDSLRERFQIVLDRLKQVGYDHDKHSHFAQNIINRYGLLDRPRDSRTLQLLKDPASLRSAVEKLASSGEERVNILVLLESLITLSAVDGAQLFRW